MADTKRQQQSRRSIRSIDIAEVVFILWAGKWFIAGVMAVAAAVSIGTALVLPNIYRAEALLAPTDRQGGAGLPGLAAQYGGIASLAGIDLGGAGVDKTAVGLEILKSRKFIADFVARRNLLVPLIAASAWNSETGDLVIDRDRFDVESNRWVRKVSAPKKTIPTMQEAYDEFMNIMSVTQDKQTGFVSIAIQHYSPVLAKTWVDWLISDLNDYVMSRDVAEAEQAIDYLNAQIAKTSLAELHSVFFSLIEEQTKTVMLAKVSDEYLLRTIDPAVIPEEKTYPRRALIVILTTFFGFMLAVTVLLLKVSLSREPRSE